MIKKTLSALLALMLCLTAPCALAAQESPAKSGHQLTLAVDYERNLYFNTYDLSLYVDDAEICVLSQGDARVVTVDIAKGEHTVSVVAHNRDKQSSSFTVDVSGDVSLTVSCKAKWTGLKITKFELMSGDEALTLREESDFLGDLTDWVKKTYEDLTK